ncbi:MAG: 1-(5-phosphoribosyl)-5-[(5-phosphoribosylamino)methylideneamino]imidazole-4-carboxamide isomerase [Chitinophagaceae bacterium]
MDDIQIRDIPLESVWTMRQSVMYPGETIDFVKLEEDEKGRHWGLHADGELISVISLFEKKGVLQFRKFATIESMQRKGYGTKLLQQVMEWAQKNDIKTIWCNARTSATTIYEKFGMKQNGPAWEKYGIGFIKMEKKIVQSKMRIIPAIDIIEGKCVRLTQGDYAQKKVYNEDPLEVAKEFEAAGLQRLHLVDLDGAKEKKVKNWKVLETIASKTSLVIDFGGGIASENDVKIVFESGAALATVGSIAIKNEFEFVKWLMIFGAEKFLLGADVKDKMIAIHGWLETTDRSIFDFIENYIGKGVQQIFCTDVSKDGKLEGPSTALYKEIITKFPRLYFIASGGVATIDDLLELRNIGCKAAIVGKAIYENRISLNELKIFL